VYPITAPPRARRGMPPRHYPPAAWVIVAGAHGGAGASTLAALLGAARDVGVVSPNAPGGGLRPDGRPVVLVARSTVTAAGRAVAAVTAMDAGGVRVTVLVVTGDGLPEPAEARYRFRVLEGRVGAVVRMPFVSAFRAAGNPRQVELPRRAQRALGEIRALVKQQARHPASATRR
jgi:hypothetical protein